MKASPVLASGMLPSRPADPPLPPVAPVPPVPPVALSSPHADRITSERTSSRRIESPPGPLAAAPLYTYTFEIHGPDPGALRAAGSEGLAQARRAARARRTAERTAVPAAGIGELLSALPAVAATPRDGGGVPRSGLSSARRAGAGE